MVEGGGVRLGIGFFSSFQFQPWEREMKKARSRSGMYLGEVRKGKQKLTIDGATTAGRVRVAEVAVRGAGCETPGRHAAVGASSMHTYIHNKRE